MKYSVIVPQGWKMDLVGISDPVKAYETMSQYAQKVESFGYDGIWLFDHFHTVPTPTQEFTFECWTTTAALARDTKTIPIGQMVTCNNYRNPALLAKMASTVDVISNGRLRFGIGGGWYEHEYTAYGYDFPEVPVRLRQLREALKIIKTMWTEKEAFFDGEFYHLHGAINQPKGVQKPHIPILVGGSGEKVTLKLVAQFADACNLSFMEPEEAKRKLAVLQDHCTTFQRDYKTILKTFLTNVSIDTDEQTAITRAKKDPNFARNAKGEEFIMQRSLIGTPEQIKKRIVEYENAGIEELILYFPQDKRDESLELFTQTVK